MLIKPDFWTTHVGSVPHLDVDELCERLVSTLDVPAWPQFVRRSFRENMYVQYSEGLPRVVVDDLNEKIIIDTSGDITPDLESFYERYLAEDIDSFALTPEYAKGFFAMLSAAKNVPGEWIKGQVTGPISVGLTVTDQNLRASLYNDLMADVLVKNAAMKARWQIRELHSVRPIVILFVDETYLASFGSAFTSLDREHVIEILNEVFEAIHIENALAGIHCCANTDWSVLLETSVDILNLDAYGYLENLALYPAELRGFLDRGSVIAWGIVPNNESVYDMAPEKIAQRLRSGVNRISKKAQSRDISITPEVLWSRSLIAPSCGLASTTIEVADQVIDMLLQTGEVLR
jgi:methionine synthase II (cobalamin-independent)